MNHQGFTSNWKLWLHPVTSTFWGWMDHPSIQSKHPKIKGFQVYKLFHPCTIYAYICISKLTIYIYINITTDFIYSIYQNQLFPLFAPWKNSKKKHRPVPPPTGDSHFFGPSPRTSSRTWRLRGASLCEISLANKDTAPWRWSTSTRVFCPPLGGWARWRTWKWLNNHGDRCCPLRIGLDWTKLQMAELHGLKIGVTNHLTLIVSGCNWEINPYTPKSLQHQTMIFCKEASTLRGWV